jgi:hypothetical protein
MTDCELLQQALDMLDDINQCSLPPTGIPLPAEIDHVMEALRARLAQPEPATRVPEGDIRALKHRIHELEGEVIGYKQILDTQPEPAECDGGQCGIGGYCKDCPKTKPELKIINMENFVGSGKPLVPVCWMNANDIDKTDWKVWAHGKPTVSMPLFASPPQREWVGLTNEDREWCDEHSYGNTSWAKQKAYGRAIEAKLKEKNT